MQFIQPKRNEGSFAASNNNLIPDSVSFILKRSCNDCHSNNTIYPWYASIQPFGWLLAKHINDGKKELNFSEFDAYSVRRIKSKLKSIEERIKDGSMPLKSYLLLHNKARLTVTEKKLIINWAASTRISL